MNALRRLRTAAWVALGATAALAAALWTLTPSARPGLPPASRSAAADSGVDLGTPVGGTPAPDFTLTDQDGRTEALSAFRGHVVLLAFVDSRCTTTCPLTAAMLRDAQTLLGPAGARVRLLAVNANPAATSVADVRRWTDAHGMAGRWRFLTGPAPALERIWRAYHIQVERDPGGEVTHTDAVYVIDAAGRERYLFLTDPDFSGTLPEAEALARRVGPLLPGHPAVRPAGALSGSPSSVAGDARFTLPTLAGGAPIRVGAGQPRLVAFFATWCQACRQDLRALDAYAALAARPAAPGADPLPPVVAVDLRVAEPSTAWVAAVVRGLRLRYPVALDATGRVADTYGVSALPYLALVSADGHILWRHVGALPPAQLERAVRTVRGGRR